MQIKLLAVLLLTTLCSNAAQPCREVKFTPLATGTMRFGDTTCYGSERPFAKDPTVIRHAGRYLMYYSAAGEHWHGAIAESTNLVDWTRLCDISVPHSPFVDGWVAPCVKKFDGKIHLFAQAPNTQKGKDGKRDNVLWHAISDDGIRFTLAPGNPIFVPNNNWSVARAIDAEVYAVGDRMMLMFATRECPGAKIQQLGIASAPYGCDYAADKWSELTKDAPFFKPELAWEMHCIEAPTVIFRKGIWYMFYAGAYNHERQQIGLAWSADGVSYKRFRDTPVLTHGPQGSWNEWESGHPGVFQDDDGEVYLFYQGKATRNGDYQLSCLKIEFID